MIKTTPFAFAKIGMLRSSARMPAPAPVTAGRERGISLIEGILYLVLAIGVVAGGIQVFQNAQLSSRVTDAARGVVTISSETRALHQNARDFGTAALTGSLLNAGAVPASFQDNAGTAIRHPWGGNVEVTGADQVFTIELEDLPSEACVRLAAVDARGQGVAGIGIASVEFTAASTPAAFGGTPGAAAVVPVPVTPVAAANGCGNQSGANVTITYAR
jgi:hypothetical protein